VYGGLRYLNLEASVDWRLTGAVTSPGSSASFAQDGTLSQRAELWDAIVGVRGRFRLGDGAWFVPCALDVGTGSSRLTLQGLVGIGYMYRWGDLLLVWRHLSYDMSDGKLLQDVRFDGAAVAATFRF
jgi:hypothetical protein